MQATTQAAECQPAPITLLLPHMLPGRPDIFTDNPYVSSYKTLQGHFGFCSDMSLLLVNSSGGGRNLGDG